MHVSLYCHFGCLVFAVRIAFCNLIERVTIRVSVFKAFSFGSRSLNGIFLYISVNFIFAVNLNAQLHQRFNDRNNLEIDVLIQAVLM